MIRSKLLSLHSDSLVRNSFYLMLTMVVVSGFGFLFWVLTARLFTTEEIGLATALIATMNLIAILSLLGFNTVFIRFLSKSEHPNKDISTGILLVAFTAFVFGSFFILFIDFFSPKLSFVQDNFVGFAFILFCIFAAVNQLLESVFLALRSTKYTLMSSTLYSSAKMLFPLLFIGYGPAGIFIAASLSQVVGFMFASTVLVRKFNFRPHIIINKDLLVRTWRYSSANYTAAIFNLLPISVLPIIITNRLGAEETAYFYISMMLGNLLYVIPWSASRSLFAEGSYNEHDVFTQIKKVIRINLFLLVPAIIFVLIFGKLLLSVFGEDYATYSMNFIWFVALAGIPIAINSTFGSLLQIKKDPRSLIVTNIFYGSTLIGLSYLFLPLGLNGIGYAWIIGNFAAALVSGLSYFFGDRFYNRLFMSTYVPRTIISLKIKSFNQYLKNGLKRKVVLFYPEKPQWYHVLYVIMHYRGYKITDNPKDKFDAAFSFADITIKSKDKILAELSSKTHLINGLCTDISKKRVDEVFEEIFNYRMSLDPRTHNGICVQKSDINATHDGKVINCPTEPEAGYVYQKLIDNSFGEDQVKDIRAIICKDSILFVIYRCRSIDDRFDNTDSIKIANIEDAFTTEEISKILAFSKAFGMDFGELDILRDNTDDRIYIVDANLTCGGPISGKHLTKSEYSDYINRIATCFDVNFLKNT